MIRTETTFEKIIYLYINHRIWLITENNFKASRCFLDRIVLKPSKMIYNIYHAGSVCNK